jgi:hypothetical protein
VFIPVSTLVKKLELTIMGERGRKRVCAHREVLKEFMDLEYRK